MGWLNKETALRLAQQQEGEVDGWKVYQAYLRSVKGRGPTAESVFGVLAQAKCLSVICSRMEYLGNGWPVEAPTYNWLFNLKEYGEDRVCPCGNCSLKGKCPRHKDYQARLAVDAQRR